jgi:WD40 repeat protein
LAFSRDGQALVTASFGNRLSWWDLRTGIERTRFTRGPDQGFGHYQMQVFALGRLPQTPCATASADGQSAALAGEDFLVCVRERAPGKAEVLFRHNTGPVAALVFSPDGKTLASAGTDHRVRLWDVASGQQRTQLLLPGGALQALAFAPNGRLLATAGSDGRVRLWDVATGRERGQLVGHQAAIRALSFSADGKRLASAGGTDTTALVWDVSGLVGAEHPF